MVFEWRWWHYCWHVDQNCDGIIFREFVKTKKRSMQISLFNNCSALIKRFMKYHKNLRSYITNITKTTIHTCNCGGLPHSLYSYFLDLPSLDFHLLWLLSNNFKLSFNRGITRVYEGNRKSYLLSKNLKIYSDMNNKHVNLYVHFSKENTISMTVFI